MAAPHPLASFRVASELDINYLAILDDLIAYKEVELKKLDTAIADLHEDVDKLKNNPAGVFPLEYVKSMITAYGNILKIRKGVEDSANRYKLEKAKLKDRIDMLEKRKAEMIKNDESRAPYKFADKPASNFSLASLISKNPGYAAERRKAMIENNSKRINAESRQLQNTGGSYRRSHKRSHKRSKRTHRRHR